MTDIKGRTAFITGGANGIGLGIARSFARAGAKLALTDIDAAALARAKEELQSNTQVETFVLDVRDRNAFEAAADAAERALGPVTLLFNNAGVAAASAIINLNYDLWDWALGINLYGVINGVQTFLKRMMMNGQGGHIVNTASGAGLAAVGNGVLYTTSKFAVVGLSEELSISEELKAFGISTSVLCPARVATDIVKRSVEATPKTKEPISDERKKKMDESVEAAGKALHELGLSIDVVGEMVLKGVQENATFIITDDLIEPAIKARSEAILKSLPKSK